MIHREILVPHAPTKRFEKKPHHLRQFERDWPLFPPRVSDTNDSDEGAGDVEGPNTSDQASDSILLVSKQVSAEGLDVLYNERYFKICIHSKGFDIGDIYTLLPTAAPSDPRSTFLSYPSVATVVQSRLPTEEFEDDSDKRARNWLDLREKLSPIIARCHHGDPENALEHWRCLPPTLTMACAWFHIEQRIENVYWDEDGQQISEKEVYEYYMQQGEEILRTWSRVQSDVYVSTLQQQKRPPAM
ncbi:MAG: hypothetical protein Q9218_004006 [Villophora microphyllina]